MLNKNRNLSRCELPAQVRIATMGFTVSEGPGKWSRPMLAVAGTAVQTSLIGIASIAEILKTLIGLSKTSGMNWCATTSGTKRLTYALSIMHVEREGSA
jgi:hypothetical protein